MGMAMDLWQKVVVSSGMLDLQPHMDWKIWHFDYINTKCWWNLWRISELKLSWFRLGSRSFPRMGAERREKTANVELYLQSWWASCQWCRWRRWSIDVRFDKEAAGRSDEIIGYHKLVNSLGCNGREFRWSRCIFVAAAKVPRIVVTSKDWCLLSAHRLRIATSNRA